MPSLSVSTAPTDATPAQRRNFLMVQIDAIGVGLASAAGPFLPVFLTRLGATNGQIGLLSSMPAIAGLIFALQIGSFLQGQKNIVPWFSRARLLVLSAYAGTGLVTVLVPQQYAVTAVLLIWALVTIPQTVVNICFSVVMSSVAGPRLRYDLMSRRWTILGLTTAVCTALVGQILELMNFPVNYQVVFIALSLGGLISFYFSSHIDLPDVVIPPRPKQSLTERLRGYRDLVQSNAPFLSFVSRRLVFMFGQSFAAPLFPLFYVRILDAPDASIGSDHHGIDGIRYVWLCHLGARQPKARLSPGLAVHNIRSGAVSDPDGDESQRRGDDRSGWVCRCLLGGPQSRLL